MINDIQNFITTFFDKLSIEIDNLDILLNKNDVYIVKIESPDSALLIGAHGHTFESIQNIFRNALSHKFDEKIMLQLEINDYIHSKDAKLFSLVDKEIKHAKEVGRNMKLPVLNGYERKKIHGYIAELNDDEIRTESLGEGKERRLFIILNRNKSPQIKIEEKRHKKLEIDIDGTDI